MKLPELKAEAKKLKIKGIPYTAETKNNTIAGPSNPNIFAILYNYLFTNF